VGRGYAVTERPSARSLCTVTAGSHTQHIMSSFENRKEPFDHICSRLSKPCIAHTPLSASQTRQYSTQDASLVVMCRFNIGNGMHG